MFARVVIVNVLIVMAPIMINVSLVIQIFIKLKIIFAKTVMKHVMAVMDQDLKIVMLV